MNACKMCVGTGAESVVEVGCEALESRSFSFISFRCSDTVAVVALEMVSSCQKTINHVYVYGNAE